MGRPQRTEQAKADAVYIWHYIALDNPNAANQLLARIDEAVQRLADMPGLGRARPELAEGLRSFPVGRYIIFYRPITDGIEIIRVLHGARDINAIFHPPDAE